MNAATRAVIERLLKVAEQAEGCLALEVILQGNVDPNIEEWQSAIAEARKLLEDDGWIRVEDALPVMPEGGKAHIWLCNTAKTIVAEFMIAPEHIAAGWSYWRPFITPQPPKEAK